MHHRDEQRRRFLAVVLGFGLAAAGCVDSDPECVTLRAFPRGAAGDGVRDAYPCFVFEAPFDESHTVYRWTPRVDPARAHHFVLYRTPAVVDDVEIPLGALGECDVPRGSQVVAAWSPGNDGMELPDGVGLELASGEERLLLQMHYVGDATGDRSGIEICARDEPPTSTAGIFVLGSVRIEIPPRARSHEVTQRCLQRQSEPLTVFATSPHMHRLGRAIRTSVRRGGVEGSEEVILDLDDFDYDRQVTRTLEPPLVINPGDVIETGCSYDNPSDETVRYGITVEDEMCFNYLTVFPMEAFGDDVRFCY